MKPQQPGDPRRRRIVWAMALGIGLLLILGIARSVLPRHNANVQVVFSHFEKIGGLDFGVFQISNTGEVPVTFYGSGAPALVYLIAKDSGTNWVYGYGTYTRFDDDDGPVKLAPGGRITVRIGVPVGGRWKAGFEYSTSPIADKLPNIVCRYLSKIEPVRRRLSIAWSGPLTRSSKPTNIVPLLQTGSGQ